MQAFNYLWHRWPLQLTKSLGARYSTWQNVEAAEASDETDEWTDCPQSWGPSAKTESWRCVNCGPRAHCHFDCRRTPTKGWRSRWTWACGRGQGCDPLCGSHPQSWGRWTATTFPLHCSHLDSSWTTHWIQEIAESHLSAYERKRIRQKGLRLLKIIILPGERSLDLVVKPIRVMPRGERHSLARRWRTLRGSCNLLLFAFFFYASQNAWKKEEWMRSSSSIHSINHDIMHL